MAISITAITMSKSRRFSQQYIWVRAARIGRPLYRQVVVIGLVCGLLAAISPFTQAANLREISVSYHIGLDLTQWSQGKSESTFPNDPNATPIAEIGSQPAVLVDGDVHHLFARNDDGDLIHHWRNVNDLSSWQKENVTTFNNYPQYRIISDPKPTKLGAYIGVYGRNAAGDLIHYFTSPDYGWTGWVAENLTTEVAPGCTGTQFRIDGDLEVINRDGTQHVFARSKPKLFPKGQDVIHYYWIAGDCWRAENLTKKYTSWNPWWGSPYSVAGDLTVINFDAYGTTYQKVFARSPSGRLIEYYWTNQDGWKAGDLHVKAPQALYDSTSRLAPGSKPNVINWDINGEEHQSIYNRNNAGELIHFYWMPSTGWRFENLTRMTGRDDVFDSDPQAVNLDRTGESQNYGTRRTRPRSRHVFGRNADGELIQYFWSQLTGWHGENLTQRPGIGRGFEINGNPQISTWDPFGPEAEIYGANQVHIFARGKNHRLVHYQWTWDHLNAQATNNGASWTASNPVNGNMRFDPVVAGGPDQANHVYAVAGAGGSSAGSLLYFDHKGPNYALDPWFEDATDILMTNDGPGDVACPVVLQRGGDVTPYYIHNADIVTNSDVAAVRALSAMVHIVNSMPYTTNQTSDGGEAGGMADDFSYILINYGEFTSQSPNITNPWGGHLANLSFGQILTHELGHYEGLEHPDENKTEKDIESLMTSGQMTSESRRVSWQECIKFLW